MVTITWADFAGILTAIVAIAGLGLSIYNLIINNREKKPLLKLRISTGGLFFGGSSSEFMLIINIANPGMKSVNVVSLKGIVNKKSTMIFTKIQGDNTFPFELASGKSANFWFPYKKFQTELKEKNLRGKVNIVFVCSDAVSNEYKKSYTINVDE